MAPILSSFSRRLVRPRFRLGHHQRPHEIAQVVGEGVALKTDSVGSDREHDARGIEPALRQHMVDEVAVQAAVAVLERMNIDKAEGQRGGRHNRVDFERRATVERRHAGDQRRQIFRPGADMVRQRHAGVAIMLADKPALLPQTQFDEARIADDDALQTQKLVQIDRTVSRLADGAAPALDAVLRRALSLNGVAGPGIFQEQESSGAGEQVARHLGHDGLRAPRQIHRGKRLQRFGAKDQRTERRRAGQVIADAVAWRILAVDSPLLPGVNHPHIRADIEIGQVEPRAGQPLVQEPDAAGITPGPLRPHQLFNGAGAGRAKQTVQDREIEALVFEGEGQVPFEIGGRRMTRGQHPPAFALDNPVVLANSAQDARQRNRQPITIDESGVPGRRAAFRQRSFVKNRYRS